MMLDRSIPVCVGGWVCLPGGFELFECRGGLSEVLLRLAASQPARILDSTEGLYL
jgi:hypothetical protein